MKKLFFLFISMAVCTIVFSQTPVSGNITVNTTWSDPVYVVTGDVTVDPGITLTISSGVIVTFDNSRSLNTYGTINATNVTFTSSNGVPSIGDWNYIRFYTGSSSTFSGCNIEYGDYLDVAAGAVLNINSSSIIEKMYYYGIYNLGTVNLTNSTIDLTGYVSYGYGIYTSGSSVTNLNTVTVSNCLYGVYIFSEGSDVDFTNSIFSSNEWPVYVRYLGDITTGAGNNFIGNTRDAFYVYPNVMSKNWTMPYVNVPWYFRSYLQVNNTYTLTIEEENILKFTSSDGPRIYGKLVANAGIGQSIYFTSDLDDNWGGDTNGDGAATAPVYSSWQGVQFFDNSDNTSVMRRCQIRYAGQGNIGGISLYDAGPTIEYCELQQNYFGAYFQYASTPNFNYNTVGSSYLTPIAMSFEANPTFTDNILSFMDNQYDAIGLLGGTLTADANVIKRDFTTVVNITYVMLAQITVPSGRLLDIEEGVVIKSSSHTYRIIIEGKLVCDGGPGLDRIVFTSVKDDNFGNPSDTNKDGTITTPAINDMGAIIFEDGHDDTSILDYVLMKYAAVWDWDYPNGGNNHHMYSSGVAIRSLVATPPGPTISNCEFRELNYGVICYQAANPIISNNSMINIIETPFAIAAASNPTFSGNTFTNCGLDALGLVGNNVVNNGAIIKRNVAGYTNITYILLENITITNSTYLDIDPGVVIKSYRKSWTIEGGLDVNGTIAEHVVFTSFRDDNVGNPMDTNGDGNATSPAAGDWDHIEFMDDSDDSYNSFNYTDISYGGYSTPYGVVRWTNAGSDGININMNNTVIDRSSTFGLWVNGDSDPIIANTSIQNCSSDPIAISLTSDPTFTNITFAANLSNGIFLIEGLSGESLSTNATLIKRNVAGFTNIPYIIDDLTINSSAVLTVEEGIIFKFRGSYFVGIYNRGGLNATGLSGQRIIFTSIKDDGAGGDTNNDGSATVPGHDDWDGIMYYETGNDAENILEYCEIKYTGGGYSSFTGGTSTLGAARVKDVGLTINETIFQIGNGSAVGIYGSAYPSITNCDMFNFAGEPIYMAMFANPTFSGNTVTNVGRLAIGIQPETYSQIATIPQRNFAGYTNITYIFYGATINSGTTITIPAGTVFKGDYLNDLVVNGKLEVAGASGNEVVFTDFRDDDYGNPADTEQNGLSTTPDNRGPEIIFNDVSDDASFIDYAFMRYTQYPVRLYSAEPAITNNTFYRCIQGVRHSGVCEPVIDNNVFDDLSNAPIAISLVAYPSSTVGNLITGTTYKMIKVIDETLTSDQILPKRSFGGIANIPYLFGNYTIGTGVTLDIDPGVICKFQSSGYMTVNNGLRALGTAASGGYIVFTSITDDFYGGDSNADGTATTYGSSSWYGIELTTFSLPAVTLFDNCIFRWCKTGNGYGIKTNSSDPTITNCSFNNCDNGVYATAASNPTINFCDFYNITTMAVNNLTPGSFTIDAEDCWWGSVTGPTHATNPTGTGETVSDGVDFTPWGASLAINPLLGDVSLNSIIQAYDATLVLLYAIDNGLSYPLTATQQNVGDVTGNGTVMALDAAHILEFIVGLRSYFNAALLSPVSNFVSDVAFNIGDANVEPGEIFEIPLTISNVSNVQAMQMIIHYDPEYLTALEFENLIQGMNTAHIIDVEEGYVKIAYAGVESLESDLTVANIKFKAQEQMGMAIETELEVEYFVANETELTWNAHNGTVNINGLATGLINHNRLEDQMRCYPNPFTDRLTIKYSVVNDGEHVFIGIYNLFGKQVAELVNGKHASETYQIIWDGTNVNGSELYNGIYFIKYSSGEISTTKKIQIVR